MSLTQCNACNNMEPLQPNHFLLIQRFTCKAVVVCLAILSGARLVEDQAVIGSSTPSATANSFFKGWPTMSFLRALKTTICSAGLLEFRIWATQGCRAIVNAKLPPAERDAVVALGFQASGTRGEKGRVYWRRILKSTEYLKRGYISCGQWTLRSRDRCKTDAGSNRCTDTNK